MTKLQEKQWREILEQKLAAHDDLCCDFLLDQGDDSCFSLLAYEEQFIDSIIEAMKSMEAENVR